MAENRAEVLSQLYALRGSISYMSERTQPVSEKEEQQQAVVEVKENKYFHEKYGSDKMSVAQVMLKKCNAIQAQRERDGLPPLSDSELADLGIAKYEKEHADRFNVEAAEENIKRCEQNLQQELKRHKKSKIATRICIVTLIIGAVLMAIYLIGVKSVALIGIGASLIWLSIMGLIFLPMKLSRSSEISKAKKYLEAATETKKMYIEQNNLIQAAKAELDSAKAVLENIKGERAELADELRPIYDATIATYSDMIDERDWEYLDVVIYYFETKRADSIKEALQLVDRMVQTNMIISAVETASKDIQNCIYNACRVLAGTITAACNKICAGLGAVVSATDMQNALYEQSNRTSSQMAADIKYIKEKTDKISKNRN